MTELTTEMERTLKVLYELSRTVSISTISKRLRIAGYKKKYETIKKELSELCEMGYAFPYSESDGFYEITGKGICHFVDQN